MGRLTPWLGFNTPGSVEASAEEIRLKHWGRPFYFTHDQLKQIKRSRIALMPIIQFLHDNPDYPRFISITTLWPWHLRSVCAALRQLGYIIVT